MARGYGASGTALIKKAGVSATRNATNSNKVESPLTSLNRTIRSMSNDVTAKTFAFNHEEAALARDWQSYMSDTSHQREVDDLRKAGLNPVLSANGGASAYSASSASGSADNSAVSMLGSLYINQMNNQNAIKLANINKEIQRESNKNNKEIAEINAAATRYASDNSWSASRYASDNALDASVSASLNNYYSSIYAADKSSEASHYSTDHSKYGFIDAFVKDLLGSGDSTSTSTLGKTTRDFLLKLKKKYK